jgi:hypothetical protein
MILPTNIVPILLYADKRIECCAWNLFITDEEAKPTSVAPDRSPAQNMIARIGEWNGKPTDRFEPKKAEDAKALSIDGRGSATSGTRSTRSCLTGRIQYGCPLILENSRCRTCSPSSWSLCPEALILKFFL